MTFAEKIIADLHVGPSTAHSLAERVQRPTEAVRTQLLRMEKQGDVSQRPICDGKLTVWYVKNAESIRHHPNHGKQ